VAVSILCIPTHFSELENQLKVWEQLQNQAPADLKILSMDGDSQSRIRELEKLVRSLQQDRDDAIKVCKAMTSSCLQIEKI